jgi:CBS-domain-containing membrane protein
LQNEAKDRHDINRLLGVPFGATPTPRSFAVSNIDRSAMRHNRCTSSAAGMETKNDVVGLIAGASGGAIAVAVMQLASVSAAYPPMAIPFATSIVLVMGSPTAEPAQPRALIGGHLLATLIGLVMVQLAGPTPWAAALAVGLAMVAMHWTRTFHPPAGIDPVVVVAYNMPWGFLLLPVAAGAILLALFAFLWHNLARRGSWPVRWW